MIDRSILGFSCHVRLARKRSQRLMDGSLQCRSVFWLLLLLPILLLMCNNDIDRR
jgi:hypothetical protein